MLDQLEQKGNSGGELIGGALESRVALLNANALARRQTGWSPPPLATVILKITRDSWRTVSTTEPDELVELHEH